MDLTHEVISKLILEIQNQQKNTAPSETKITYLESEGGVCVQVEVDGKFMLISVDAFNEFIREDK